MKNHVLDSSKRTDQFLVLLVHLRMARFSISNLVTYENQVLDSSKRTDQFLIFIFFLTAFVFASAESLHFMQDHHKPLDRIL